MVLSMRSIGKFIVHIALTRQGGVASEDADAYDDYDLADALTSEQLRNMHSKFDLDGNGKASLEEVLSFAARIGLEVARKDIGTVLQEIDTDKDSHVNLDEHLNDIHSQAEGGDEAEMKELEVRKSLEARKFAAADSNGDGKLQSDELAALFYPETHDGVLTVSSAENLKLKDLNGDGKLSVREFWEAGDADAEGVDLSQEELSDFGKLDTDGDGFLNLDELKTWDSGRFHTAEAMTKMFEIADKDNDFHVTAQELQDSRDSLGVSDAQYHLLEWAEHHEL